MVGRTPEYLGKKIEMFEMKMTILLMLIINALVKVGTAVAVIDEGRVAGIANPGPHGSSEILTPLRPARTITAAPLRV